MFVLSSLLVHLLGVTFHNKEMKSIFSVIIFPKRYQCHGSSWNQFIRLYDVKILCCWMKQNSTDGHLGVATIIIFLNIRYICGGLLQYQILIFRDFSYFYHLSRLQTAAMLDFLICYFTLADSAKFLCKIWFLSVQSC